MNTYEIEGTIAKDCCLRGSFIGVFPIDQLPVVSKKPACLIANTDPSDKPGEHWVALYIDKFVEYFDSYGLDPYKQFSVYKPDWINKYCLQNLDSAVCGEYCIYYLYKRGRGIEAEHIVDSLRKCTNADYVVKTFVDKRRFTSNTVDKGQGCIVKCK